MARARYTPGTRTIFESNTTCLIGGLIARVELFPVARYLGRMTYHTEYPDQAAHWPACCTLAGGDALKVKYVLPVALMSCIFLFFEQFAQAGFKTIVFVHVNVVPMDGNRILADQNVTVVDDKVSSIEPAATAAVPKGAQVIDGTGKFLMPV